jgi:Asp-tRNA(Asn)/Glu-tRNA(Gln) amidotransferase A subunit family amidase
MFRSTTGKLLLLLAILVPLTAAPQARQQAQGFRVEEATIASIHAAIRSGQTTCRGVVQAYIDRARAYNGVCTALVTRDGEPIAPATGYVRAGAPLTFPTQTVAASAVFPDLDKYKGLPLDYGRMEPTVSDPSVMHQMGMRVGVPNAGQLNALETINIRGERSITCKGRFDAHPSTGPLPKDAPPQCEEFRKQPDALERAAELDAKYGRNPDLAAMPLYCVTASFKDPYDTKDMRTTSNNDVNFAMDVPPFDSTIVARMRAKGAIIYAKSVASEFNGGPGNPGGDAKQTTQQVSGGQQMNSWSGQPCNPYDTTRVPRGTSNGSGVSVGANLVTVGICEQTAASCQGPASRNGITLLLTTKGLTPDSGGIGNQFFQDRSGIHARTLTDAAKVLDGIRDGANGYYDPRDPFTAIPRALVPKEGYASVAIDDAALKKDSRPLKGMRIAILREHQVKRTANHVAISDQTDREFKTILRDKLGAELLETVTPEIPDDPTVPNLRYSFSDALSELLPRMMPEIFKRKNADGTLAFAVPGHDVTSYDYLLKLSRRQAPLTPAINMTNFASFAAIPCHSPACSDVRFDIDRYLAERGDTRITTWKAWVANAKFDDESSRAGAENWANLREHAEEGKSDRLARSHIARMALLKVMYENDIDVFVHAENTVPTPKLLGPNVGTASLDGITPFFQIPKIVVPAGFTDVEVAPAFALNAAGTNYTSVLRPGASQTRMEHPMPIAITFFAGQGEESTLIKVGTAYEAATHHRKPPPAFGPVKTPQAMSSAP